MEKDKAYPTTHQAKILLEKFQLGQNIFEYYPMMQVKEITVWDYSGDFLCAIGKPVVREEFGLSRYDLSYDFYYKGKLLFSGNSFSPSPLHSCDTKEALADIVGWLSLKPGDTDAEYFDDYTEEQLRFAEFCSDDLYLWEEELRGER